MPMLPTPGFHHLHLNSVDPDAAIDFYVRQFPSTSKTTWGGMPALASPNDVLILFEKVDRTPTIEPQSAIWHFGWHIPDIRGRIETYKKRPDVKLLPLYTEQDGEYVLISSDTYQPTSGAPGLTKAQIAEAKARGEKPKGGGGFAYMQGPDDALVEYVGDHPTEYMNHIHMWQEDPFCAQLWYRKHLNAPQMEGRGLPAAVTESSCKVPRGPDRSFPALTPGGMYRAPRAAVTFGDVALAWYANQGEKPLASPRGQLYDHIALSVTDLDAWVAKLKGEGVTFLEQPYKLGNTRAAMIEGPSREALELVEVK